MSARPMEISPYYCDRCEDTGYVECLNCGGEGVTEGRCMDDLCVTGCFNGACAPEVCRRCKGSGGWECSCEGKPAEVQP